MLVFTQERHAIEREPRWRRVRAQRKAFEKILDDVLARGEADGSMTFADRRPLPPRPAGDGQLHRRSGCGRTAASPPREIADGYCALVLAENPR